MHYKPLLSKPRIYKNKMLVNAGIKCVVATTNYAYALIKEILLMAKIKVEIVKLDNISKECNHLAK